MKRFKILLIDDDPDFVETTKAVLENEYQVIVAYNGEDGLKTVVEERPELIILDVVMPGKDGFEVCKELKQNPRYYFFSKIPVLLLTVFPGGIEKTKIPLQAGMATEAEGYVQKPVSPEALLREVQQLLREHV